MVNGQVQGGGCQLVSFGGELSGACQVGVLESWLSLGVNVGGVGVFDVIGMGCPLGVGISGLRSSGVGAG